MGGKVVKVKGDGYSPVLPGAPVKPILSQGDFVCSFDVCTLDPTALDLPFLFCAYTYFVYF